MNHLENKVIYQIYPKSFKDTNNDGWGDIQGIIEKLDYLVKLGVDYLWLSPINQSPQNDNGYDISDYYTIDSRFGGLDDYKQLIEEANDRGIKIMMDLVLNHTSTEHAWFQSAIAGDAYYQNFYIFRPKPTDAKSVFGGSAWNFIPELNQYYLCMFDKTQADLNWDNPAVRAEIIKMVNYWIDLGVEGFRLDVIENISKDIDAGIFSRGPNFLNYLQELSSKTFKNRILTVGECWNPPLLQMQQMCNEQGLTQAFHFGDITVRHNPNKWNLKPLNLNALVQVLAKWQNDYEGIPALNMNNHDSPRLISVWLDDQRYRYASATLLITVYSMLKGNLYLYQGEEIGMTNAYVEDIQWYDDIETINAYKELREQGLSDVQAMQKIMPSSRDNARVCLAWDDSTYAGFSQAKPWLGLATNYQEVNVANDLTNQTHSIYRYYQQMLALRKRIYPSLKAKATFNTSGDLLEIHYDNTYQLLANFGSTPLAYNSTPAEVLISNYPPAAHQAGQVQPLQPYQVVVLKKTHKGAL